jgi:hypothetical protein
MGNVCVTNKKKRPTQSLESKMKHHISGTIHAKLNSQFKTDENIIPNEEQATQLKIIC